MKALTFRLSLPRLAWSWLAGLISPRARVSRLGPLGLLDSPEPTLPAEDWLVLDTHYCGICGSDVKQCFLEGNRDNPITALISFPHVLGHELVGRIRSTGSAVSDLRPGQRIVVNPWLGCAARGLELCAACAEGKENHCRNFTRGPLGAGIHLGNSSKVSGGFAPRVAAHRSMCFPIPDDVPDEVAVLADPFAVALHAVGKAPPEPGDKVVVVGCGAVGLMVVHVLSRLYEDVEVLAVDLLPHLEAATRELGADHFTTSGGGALIREVAEWTDSELHQPMQGPPWLIGGAPRVYDTVGTAGTLETNLRLTRAGGRVVLVGVANPKRFEWTPLYFKEVELVGSSGFGNEVVDGKSAHAFTHFMDLASAGRIDPGGLVTHRFPLSAYREAILVARDKERHGSLKVLLDPREPSTPGGTP